VNKRIEREAQAKRRAAEIKGLREEGLTMSQIAERLGVGRRTVFRRKRAVSV